MNKHSVIVIIASIVIASTVGFSGWNVYAANQLQIQGPEGRFSYYEMMSDGSVKICNPTPFYVNFNGIKIVSFFEEGNKGTFSIPPVTLSPSSSLIVNGTFESDSFVEIQYLFLHFDTMFSGVGPVRIDPRKFSVATEIQTPIIGVIPYSVTKQYSGMDFWDTMNGKNDGFKC